MNTLYLDPRGCNHADMHYTGKCDGFNTLDGARESVYYHNN